MADGLRRERKFTPEQRMRRNVCNLFAIAMCGIGVTLLFMTDDVIAAGGMLVSAFTLTPLADAQ